MLKKTLFSLLFLMAQGSIQTAEKGCSPARLKNAGVACLAFGGFNTVVPIGHILVANSFCCSCIPSSVATGCCMAVGLACFTCGGIMIDKVEKEAEIQKQIQKELIIRRQPQHRLSDSD